MRARTHARTHARTYAHAQRAHMLTRPHPRTLARTLARTTERRANRYSVPLFVRFLPEMEVTGTFKHKKVEVEPSPAHPLPLVWFCTHFALPHMRAVRSTLTPCQPALRGSHYSGYPTAQDTICRVPAFDRVVRDTRPAAAAWLCSACAMMTRNVGARTLVLGAVGLA